MDNVNKGLNRIVFEPVAGYTISRAITEAIKMSSDQNSIVILRMNDIEVIVTKKSNAETVNALYLRLLDLKHKKTR